MLSRVREQRKIERVGTKMNRPELYLQNGQLNALVVMEYINTLEKALDKACEVLYEKDCEEYKEAGDFIGRYLIWSREQWKEWALRVVSED